MTSRKKHQKNSFDLISQFLNSDKQELECNKTISEIFVLDRQIYERDLAIGIYYCETGKKFVREQTGDYLQYGNKQIHIVLRK